MFNAPWRYALGISVQRIVVGVALFMAGFVMAILAFEEWKVAKEIAPSITTLAAAFFGAWFAFLLQIKEKEDKERKEIVASVNQVLFSLFQRANSLKLFQIDNIDPLRNNPGIHIAMLPILSVKDEVIKFNIDKLDFLLETKHKQLVFDLYVEDRRYESAVNVIEHRSNLHLHEVQPMIQAGGIKQGKDYPESAYREALGEMLYTHLKNSTEQVVYHVDRTVKSTMDAKNNLLRALKDVYPDEKFIDFELPE